MFRLKSDMSKWKYDVITDISKLMGMVIGAQILWNSNFSIKKLEGLNGKDSNCITKNLHLKF